MAIVNKDSDMNEIFRSHQYDSSYSETSAMDRMRSGLKELLGKGVLVCEGEETTLLAWMAQYPSVLDSLGQEIRHEYFTKERSGLCFVIMSLISRGMKVSIATVTAEVERSEYSEEYKYALYGELNMVVSMVIMNDDTSECYALAKTVREFYLRRECVIRLSNTLIRSLMGEDKNMVKEYGKPLVTSAQMLGALEHWLTELATVGDAVQIREHQEVSEHVVNHFTKGEESYFPTGIEAIDKSLVGGFHVGRTYCFAALPKMGKTTLLSSMYSNQRMMGIPSAYIALEMSDMQIEERILCYRASLRGTEYMRAKTDDELRKRYSESLAAAHVRACQSLQGKPKSYYVDCPGIPTKALFRTMRGLVYRGIKMFYVDHVGLVKNDIDKKNQNGQAWFLSEVTAELERFAKRHGCAIAYAQQVNRDNKLFGSDGALQHADMVLRLVAQAEQQGGERPFMLVMERSRYTPQQNIGEAKYPLMHMSPYGPFAEDRLSADGVTMAKERAAILTSSKSKFTSAPRDPFASMMDEGDD